MCPEALGERTRRGGQRTERSAPRGRAPGWSVGEHMTQGGVGHSENLVLCALGVRHPHESPSARCLAVQTEYFFCREFISGSSVGISCRPSSRILGS